MKIRNYLMYWANRLMDPEFKNEYYQANLKQFWEQTYEGICICSGVGAVISLLLFPWGINFSESHPLYNAGWSFAVGQYLISMGIGFVFAVSIERILRNKDRDKLESVVWLYILSGLSSLAIQHVFTKALYRIVPWPLVASLTPLMFLWLGFIGISNLPHGIIDKLNQGKNKVVESLVFLVMDSKTGKFRLTAFLEKNLGQQPPSEKHVPAKDLAVPKPKDYKIWGVKSDAEKELQKILDE